MHYHNFYDKFCFIGKLGKRNFMGQIYEMQ